MGRYLEIRGEFLSSGNGKSDFVVSDTLHLPPRLRTQKEASHLLEDLRTAYQSLVPEKQREAKILMSQLSEVQRRFGSSI